MLATNGPPCLPPDREGRKSFIGMVMSAFSNDGVTIEDQIAEGDKVLNRWSSKSTHSGEFGGSCDW